VTFDEPKLLTGSNQKVRGQAQGHQRSPATDVAPPAERHNLPPWVMKRNEVRSAVLLSPYTTGAERAFARSAYGMADQG